MRHEHQGRRRATYREAPIEQLASELAAKFGKGFSQSNLASEGDPLWPILQTVSEESHPSELASEETPKLQTPSGPSGGVRIWQRSPFSRTLPRSGVACLGRVIMQLEDPDTQRGPRTTRVLNPRIEAAKVTRNISAIRIVQPIVRSPRAWYFLAALLITVKWGQTNACCRTY